MFIISKGIDTITDFSLEEGDQIAVDADKLSDLEILTNPLGGTFIGKWPVSNGSHRYFCHNYGVKL